MSDCVDRGEYVNIGDALGRLGGNMGLYKMLLKRFDGFEYISEIEESLSSGDREKAVRAAHSLKGVSANLSFEVLRVLAADLESLLTNGDDHNECLTKIKDALIVTKEKITEIEAQ